VKYVPLLVEVSLVFEIQSNMLSSYITVFFFFLPQFYQGLEVSVKYLWENYVYFIFCFSLEYRYELAEECADDDDAKLSISELRKAVLEELKMHDSFVQVR
jgi:hypothetical protein